MALKWRPIIWFAARSVFPLLFGIYLHIQFGRQNYSQTHAVVLLKRSNILSLVLVFQCNRVIRENETRVLDSK